MTKINWNITDQELKQELVSSDNRWHISKTQKGEEESKFFLTNYDLLLLPTEAVPITRSALKLLLRTATASWRKSAASNRKHGNISRL